MKGKPIRTSLDLPADLHERIHAAARRRGCSARQLYLDRLAAEESSAAGRRAEGPFVPAAGRGVIRDVSNDEALFGDQDKTGAEFRMLADRTRRLVS